MAFFSWLNWIANDSVQAIKDGRPAVCYGCHNAKAKLLYHRKNM